MRYLIIAAIWAEGDPAPICDNIVDLIEGNVIERVPDAGVVVALEEGNVDAGLRAMLRTMGMDEVANA